MYHNPETMYLMGKQRQSEMLKSAEKWRQASPPGSKRSARVWPDLALALVSSTVVALLITVVS